MDLSHEDAKQVKNGYRGNMKIKKITPPFVPKGKQKIVIKPLKKIDSLIVNSKQLF